jgi:hypothetical protein
MKTQKIYRQGDVMFIPCDNIPQGTKRANGTVAYGEVTGHSHRLADLATADVFECGDGLYVRVSEDGISINGQPGCSFIHEEHGPINLPPGSYKVGMQREYSPADRRIIRDVID